MGKINNKNNRSIGSKFFESIALSVIAAFFVISGFFIIIEGHLSVSGSRLRGMAWEAQGVPAVILGIFSIYIGSIIIYYTFRK